MIVDPALDSAVPRRFPRRGMLGSRASRSRSRLSQHSSSARTHQPSWRGCRRTARNWSVNWCARRRNCSPPSCGADSEDLSVEVQSDDDWRRRPLTPTSSLTTNQTPSSRNPATNSKTATNQTTNPCWNPPARRTPLRAYWRQRPLFPARPPMPRHDRCTLRYPSSFLHLSHGGTIKDVSVIE